MKKYANDNPMPSEVYSQMIQYLPQEWWGSGEYYDLHHALIDKGDVQGMPLSEREKIHNPVNLWWVKSSEHASHADIQDKRDYYRLLCERWGKDAVDKFILSFVWKSYPPITLEWLNHEYRI